MANVQLMAPADGEQITFRISRAASEMIARAGDRQRAGVRLIPVKRGGSAEIRMTLARADDLMAWADDAWRNVRGVERRILTSLIRSIASALRTYRARDCIPDPGIASIDAAKLDESACLNIGTVVVDANDDLVQVIAGPGFYRVARSDGRYADKDGKRFDWCYGYLVANCADGGMLSKVRYFVHPHELWSKDDGGITYLKLVHNADSSCAAQP